MKNIFLGVVLGFVLGIGITIVWAKTESGSSLAKSQVGYGKYGSLIIPLQVTSDGTLVLTQ